MNQCVFYRMILWKCASMLVFFCINSTAFSQTLETRLTQATAERNDTARAMLLRELADSVWTFNPPEAEAYALQAAILAKTLHLRGLQAYALSTLGWCRYVQIKYPLAMEAYLQGQIIAEEENDSTTVARILDFKGIMYNVLCKDPLRALEQHRRAFEWFRFARTRNDSVLLMRLTTDIGADFAALQQPDSSLRYLRMAMPLTKRFGDTLEIVLVQNYVAKCLFMRGARDSALVVYRGALALGQRNNLLRTLTTTLLGMARVYNAESAWRNALEVSNDALRIALRTGSKDNILEAYGQLGAAYRHINADSAVHYQALYIKLQDTVFSNITRNSTLIQQVDFEISKKEVQILALQEDSKRRTAIGAGLGVAAVIFVIAAIVFFRIARRERFAKRELKAAQTQLVQSERMNAVGMLTAGVMHEINNPNAIAYTAISQTRTKLQEMTAYFFSLLDEESKDSEEVKRFETMSHEAVSTLDLASDGAARVRAIVANLQGFTKHQEHAGKMGNLTEEIRSTVALFRLQFKDVALELSMPDEISFAGNFGELNQVFLNLLVNAAQAGATAIRIESEKSPSHVSVRFADNGGGISETVKQKIFEPFFSTKGKGNSGLGLSISKQIVERHGGRLGCESLEGKGTTFIVELPSAPVIVA